jgi:hypothetical protein
MKILIIIPLWQRPEVFTICAGNLTEFINACRPIHDIKVLTVVSPEDPYINDLVAVCLEHGFDTIYKKNTPVSEKLNLAIQYSRSFDYDYLMNLGSDNLIHPDIFNLYQPYFDKQADFFGISNFYAYDLISKKALFLKQYNNNKCVGAGRMMSKNLIRMMFMAKQPVYDRDINRGMDVNSSRRITSFTGIRNISIEPGKSPMIVDLKNDVNINSFSMISLLKHKISNVKAEVLSQAYPSVKAFL